MCRGATALQRRGSLSPGLVGAAVEGAGRTPFAAQRFALVALFTVLFLFFAPFGLNM